MFVELKRLMTMYTTVYQWSLSWAKLNQSMPSNTISLWCIYVPPTYLCLGCSSDLLPPVFWSTPSHLSNVCYMPHLPHPPLLSHPNNIYWRVHSMKFLITQLFPTSSIKARTIIVWANLVWIITLVTVIPYTSWPANYWIRNTTVDSFSEITTMHITHLSSLWAQTAYDLICAGEYFRSTWAWEATDVANCW